MGFAHHAGHPFASVHIPVKDDCWLTALTTASPEVNTSNWSALNGVACSYNLRSGWILGNQLVEEGDVVSIGMVVVEPCQVSSGSSRNGSDCERVRCS